MKRTAPQPGEATRALLQQLGEKWTIAILDALAERPHRYSELRRQFTLTSKVLTRTLKGLERHGFVARLESPGMRRQVDYELTPVGRSLGEFVRNFEQWLADEHDGGRARSATVDAPPKDATPGRAVARSAARPDTEPLRDLDADVDLQLRFVTVAVHDIEKSAAAFARIFGMPVPERTQFAIAVPPDQRALLGLAWFGFPSFAVCLAQPLQGPTPHRDFLARFGEGIHHLGFSSNQNIDQVIARFQRKGGRWTVGGRGLNYAQLDFRHQLGAALGISASAQAGYRSAKTSENPEVDTLARYRVTNVGIVVRDIDEATRAYAELLGLGVSEVRTVDVALPGVAIVSYGSAKIAYLKQHGIALKLIEPQSPGPLQDFVDRHGNRAHHLGFEVGPHFSAVVTRLEGLGGQLILGRRDLGYALIDLTPELGVVLEVSGTPARRV